ncbi:RDD family protein [Agrococcus sp. Marseille-P2731]|uniref:RDD family protein n=1 Tax=Agrococcus sp. Marseille-P2731 TaxID=1841862 RepID=UPI0009300184|nr:RDD family protein [Agrococcus sp. Marseille-P2731]
MIWEIEDNRTVIEGLDEHGRPDPAYAAALGLKPAPLGRRVAASLIEFAMFAFLQLPYWIVAVPTLVKVATGAISPSGFLSHPDFFWMVIATAISAALTLAFVVVQLVLHARRGVTLGKAMLGIRSVHVKTLAKPGFGRVVLRALVMYASFFVPVVGPALFFSSVFFDGEKRGRSWLDKVGATWFVDVKQGLDPYHEKRMRIARKTVSAEPEAAKSELPSLATPAERMGQAYRPGARLSSGVVGAARPQEPGRPQVGLAGQAPAEPVPSQTVPGMPAGGARLGGYRPGELSGRSAPSAPAQPTPASTPAPASAPVAPATSVSGIVDSVPGRERAAQAPAYAPAPLAQPAAQPPASMPPAPAAAAAHPPSAIDDATVIEPDYEDLGGTGVAGAVAGGAEVDDSTIRRVEIGQDDDEDLDVTRARPSARAAVATLVFDTGDRFAITGAALVGRNPAPTAGEVVEHLLPIADDTRSISKTHLLIATTPLAAIDRASTNGSSVIRAGVEHELEPGVPFPLAVGDAIRFGDRTVVVEPAAAGGAAGAAS